MTSVALITAVTLSPFLRPISSALRLVITDSTTLSPTFTVMSAVTVPRITSVISPFKWLRALSAIKLSPHSALSQIGRRVSERDARAQNHCVVVRGMIRYRHLVACADGHADAFVDWDASDQ